MTTTDRQPAPLSSPATPAAIPPDPEHPAARLTFPWWGDAVVGAAFAAEEAATDLIADLRRVAAQRRQRVARLVDRGATERMRWQRRAEETARAAVVSVAASPLVDRVVDRQLERVLRPVVRAVLDDVLLLLETEPERIQELIRGQRESMVDELVGRLRAGAAGDTVVDRLSLRMFRRGHRPEPAPPPDL